MATILTDECKAGHDAPLASNPYLFSSDAWMAFDAGQRLAGIAGIKKCLKSRGHSVRIASTSGVNTYRVDYKGRSLSDVLIIRD